MVKNFFNFIITKDELRQFGIKQSARIKQFIFKFISVSGKWIRTARQNILKLYTNKPYRLLFDS